MNYSILITVVCSTLCLSRAVGQEMPRNTDLTANEIMEKSEQAFHYQGDDLKVKLVMQLIHRDGGVRERVMTMLRKDDEDDRKQRYFIYFHEPGDVRGMTFMVWKYPGQEDDRWIFVPAVDLIRRIAADDKRSSFVGSDFTYEDVSGRDLTSDEHTLLRKDTLQDRTTYVVQSVPKEPIDYTKRIAWVDDRTFLPLKEEYYDVQDQLYRVFTADEVEEIRVSDRPSAKAYPTVTKRTMTNVKTGHRTEVSYTEVSYNIDLNDDDFSERRMRRPPRAWIQ